MELLERKNNHEGVEFLTLDFRDAFKQLHVVPAASSRTGRCYLVWDLAHLCGVEWQLGSCVAPKRG